jgi:uncharacterized integral membrane protein
MKPMRILKLSVAALVVLLLLMVVVQNTEVVTLRFFVWQLKMSQVVLLPLAILTGFLLGFLLAKWRGRGA